MDKDGKIHMGIIYTNPRAVNKIGYMQLLHNVVGVYLHMYTCIYMEVWRSEHGLYQTQPIIKYIFFMNVHMYMDSYHVHVYAHSATLILCGRVVLKIVSYGRGQQHHACFHCQQNG